MVTATRPAFRKPWENGAHAYPEADTFAAAREGFRRVRKGRMFHMPNTGEAGQESCAYCHGKLAEPALAAERGHGNGTRSESSASASVDRMSTWHYSAARKTIYGGQHYVCSWSNLLGDIAALRHY